MPLIGTPFGGMEASRPAEQVLALFSIAGVEPNRPMLILEVRVISNTNQRPIGINPNPKRFTAWVGGLFIPLTMR